MESYNQIMKILENQNRIYLIDQIYIYIYIYK